MAADEISISDWSSDVCSSYLLPAGLPLLYADERAIKQILLNLLANAVKFTKSGGKVTIEVQRTADGLELAVSDTGIGIAPADQQRVFEPFVQVESALNRQIGRASCRERGCK